MTKSKILLELKLIPAWRKARAIQPSSSRGCPARWRGRAEEHSAMLVQTWLSLTRGCCYLLGPKVWQSGAAGEEAGTGTGSACPGFCGLPKAAEHRQTLAVGCRGVGLALGGCLGEPVAIWRVMLWHWGWGSSAGKPMPSQIIYPRSLLQSSNDAAGRSLLAPQGKMLSGAPVITQNLRPPTRDCSANQTCSFPPF